MQNFALQSIESMLRDHVVKRSSAIDINIPNGAVVLIPKAKVGLECITLQDPGAKVSFDEILVRILKLPPGPNHLGRPIRVPFVEAGREPPWVVDDLVELERLRWVQSAHCAEQRGLSGLVFPYEACDRANLELLAILHRTIVLDPYPYELHFLTIPWMRFSDKNMDKCAMANLRLNSTYLGNISQLPPHRISLIISSP